MFKLNKLAVITAALASTTAFAGVNGNDTYLGVGFGQSQLSPEYKDGTDAGKDRDLALQAFLGQDLNENFGIELNYADLGNFDAADMDYNVTSLQGVVNFPSSADQLSLYGKLGVSYIDVTTSTNTALDADYDTAISGALGVRWNLSENWFARAEYNYYNEDLQAAFLQFAYAWGAEPAPVVVPAEPVVEEVAPEPIFVTIDDSKNVAAIFDFDSATINDSSRLDQIATMLEDSKGQIVVRAHTDSMGPEAYNQKLSEERAQSAVEYFVSKGIDSSRFLAQGMGELYPAVSNDTKEGRAQNRRLEVGYSVEKQQ